MKRRFYFIAPAAILIAACTPPAPLPGEPDLVISGFEVTGAPSVDSGEPQVPVRVVAGNVGGGPAGRFKVSTDFTEAGGSTFAVAFSVPGQDIWYPFTSGELGAGQEVSFEGVLLFNAVRRGDTVEIRAVADSCSGDEFMPAHCRVEESDEGNNRSSAISVSLP